MFELVCEFVVSKKPIQEILTAEMLQMTPTLFDSFAAALNYLHPIDGKSEGRDTTEERYDKLCWQVAPLIDLETARAILEATKTMPESDRLPFAVERAHEVLLQAAFFASDIDASEHFKMVKSSREQKELGESTLARMEATLARHNSDAHRALIAPTIQHQRVLISACDGLLMKAKKRVDINYLTTREHAILAAKSGDRNPSVQRLVVQSANHLLEYSKGVLEAFRVGGADLSRTDLIEYFTGQKGLLLEHYDLYANPAPTSPSYPFSHKIKKTFSYFYNLTHNSAYDVESEIRNDLRRRGFRLPERLITEQACTKPQTAETVRLREEIMLDLRTWDALTDATKRNICQKLLHHLKWDELFPDEITLSNNDTTARLADERIVLSIKKYQGLSFRLNLWDLTTCYDQFDELQAIPSYEALKNDHFPRHALIVPE